MVEYVRIIFYIAPSICYSIVIGFFASKAEERLSVFMPVNCPDISGRYFFFGVWKENGQSTSFLDWNSRRSLNDVKWMEITNADNKGIFRVFFMNRLGKSIGNVLELDTSCVDGQWERRRKYEGYADGTSIKGTKIWRYFRDRSGALVVVSQETSASQYFPGLPWRRSSPAQGIATFPPYKDPDRGE